MNTLEFIFQSFWHYVGVFLLLAVIAQWKPFNYTKSNLSSKQIDKLVDALKKKKFLIRITNLPEEKRYQRS